MVSNKAFILKAIPKGWPQPGQDLTVEDIGFDLSAPPPKNGFTTKNLYAAFDPSQRGRMRDPAVTSYSAAIEVGTPVLSVSVIGTVLKSDNDRVKEGQTVLIWGGRTETFSAVTEEGAKMIEIIEEKEGVPLTAYLGLLGMTGMTAYGSLHEIGEPKKGDVILVSAAAGAVGQMVAQIAVKEGLYVIGSVGDDTKVKFCLEELGVQACFNYKKESVWDAVKRLAPDGLDIYYDNVGGELLDCALANMKDFGRIGKLCTPFVPVYTDISSPPVACGAISQYNNASAAEAYGVKNYMHVVRRRLKWQGFLVFDPFIVKHRPARDENITKWIQDGSFKSVDHVTVGMENAIDGFLGMLRGRIWGKVF